MIRVRPIPGELQSLGDMLPAKTVRRVLISAVNDASKWGETRLNRLIRETLTLNRQAVDDAITRRTTRDDKGGFGQQTTVSRQKVFLKQYGIRQTKKGISVRFLKGGKRELIRHAFMVKTFGDNAYKRKGKARTPTVKLKGPTAIGALLRRDDDVNRIRADVGERVVQRFTSKLDYELSKIASKL